MYLKSLTDKDKTVINGLFFGRSQDECLEIIELLALEESIKYKLYNMTNVVDYIDPIGKETAMRVSAEQIHNRVNLLRNINDKLGKEVSL